MDVQEYRDIRENIESMAPRSGLRWDSGVSVTWHINDRLIFDKNGLYYTSCYEPADAAFVVYGLLHESDTRGETPA